MDVTMDKISGRVSRNELLKAFEPSVAPVFSIVDMPYGCVCDNDIYDTALPPDSGFKSANDLLHLFFRVLIGAAIVPSGPLQPEKFQAFVLNQFSMNIGAALGRFAVVPDIMVPFDVEQGRIEG
jgi:hypothetical protein